MSSILEIEWNSFNSSEDRFELQQMIDLYRVNPRVFTVAAVAETGELVGYTCLIPLLREYASRFEAGDLDIQDVLAHTALADLESPALIDYMLDSLVLKNPDDHYIGALLIRHLVGQLVKVRKLYGIAVADYGRAIFEKLGFMKLRSVEKEDTHHDFFISCAYDSTSHSPVARVFARVDLEMRLVCEDCLYYQCYEWARHNDRARLSGKLTKSPAFAVRPKGAGGRPVISRTPAHTPTLGIITALSIETVAVQAFLHDNQKLSVPGSGAGRRYTFGTVPAADGGSHKIVLTQADKGNNIASIRATLLIEHFPTVRSIIMVGIAGAVPCPSNPEEHVRLGDVVVSDTKGVI